MTTAAAFALNSSYVLSNANFRVFPLRRLASLRISASSSSSSSSTEFKISFAPPAIKTLVPDPSPQDPSSAPVPVIIPWIVRDGNGGFIFRPSSPDSSRQCPSASPLPLRRMKRKIKTFLALTLRRSIPRPQRRFYNQNFREPQRLSKVLAAAGVALLTLCIGWFSGIQESYICSNGEESKSVVSLIDDYWKSKANHGIPRPRLFTVGLDVATTGLIIVTNDGDFAQRISHPSSNFTKEYIANIEGVVHRRHLISISEGTEVDGVHCVPDSVELLSAQADAPRPRLRIVVHEGRNHEVRELIKNSGLQALITTILIAWDEDMLKMGDLDDLTTIR
ncbi:hypothetical protein HPP92_026516 [Vanilla planifolia]|uniref:Pseudouridine synthase RsuA/RluA-like domain-containing protein n=1 Tax=Vanilla planifolia TaxID=51239 RepID=A0A835PG62_VANPL|nr:hypothetical protein HPP92_026516 [Vanilla planifolia]